MVDGVACAEGAAGRLFVSSKHRNDFSRKIPRDEIDASVPELDLDIVSLEVSRRVTPNRDARQQRRIAVAAAIAERDAVKIDAGNAMLSDSLDSSKYGGGAVAQLSSTSVIDFEHASPISKRQSTSRPKWQPTTCTAPGVTCGSNGSPLPATKVEMRSDASPVTEPLFSRLAKRVTQPLPRLPFWWPMICTAPGITCAGSDSSSDSNSSSDGAEPPSATTAKRDAQPLAMTEAQPAPWRKIPKWKPTSCTSAGITCGDSSSVDEGDTSGNAGTDGASSATSQSGTGGQTEQRDVAVDV